MNKLFGWIYLKLVSLEREDFIKACDWFGYGLLGFIAIAFTIIIIYNILK